MTPEVPGGLYRIATSTPDPKGEVVLAESVTFERADRTAADAGEVEMSRVPLAAALLAAALAAPGRAHAAPANYPTEALGDYLLGCMASNGQTPDALRRCSCSIDYIAGKVPYDDYVQASTVLSLRQVPGGGRESMFKSAPWAQAMVDKLRQAQVEAEAKCSGTRDSGRSGRREEGGRLRASTRIATAPVAEGSAARPRARGRGRHARDGRRDVRCRPGPGTLGETESR